MIAKQIELTNEMDWQAVLVADTYNQIIEAADGYGFNDDCKAAYVKTRVDYEIGESISLIDSYIAQAETMTLDDMPQEVQEEYADWVVAVAMGYSFS